MKPRICLMLFFVLSVAISSLVAASPVAVYDGDSHISRDKSLKPVIATSYVQNGSIAIQFRTNVGSVEVLIKDESGAVCYRKNVNTLTDRSLNIDISCLASGTYTLSFNDMNGVLIKSESFVAG